MCSRAEPNREEESAAVFACRSREPRMGRSRKKAAAAAPASTAAASSEPADKSAPDVSKGDCDEPADKGAPDVRKGDCDEPADKSAPDVSVGDGADAAHHCDGGGVVMEHDGASGCDPNDDRPDDMNTELVQPALVDAREAHSHPCGLDHAATADRCMEAAQSKDGQGDGLSREGAHPPSFTSVLPDQSEAVSSSVATPQGKIGQRPSSPDVLERAERAMGILGIVLIICL